MLQSVLNESLQPIQTELKLLNQRVRGIEDEVLNVKSQINNRFDSLETKVASVQVDVSDIKAGVERLEENEPKDILAMLSNLDKKLDVNHEELVDELQDLKLDLDFTYQKTTLNERELHKLKFKQ